MLFCQSVPSSNPRLSQEISYVVHNIVQPLQQTHEVTPHHGLRTEFNTRTASLNLQLQRLPLQGGEEGEVQVNRNNYKEQTDGALKTRMLKSLQAGLSSTDSQHFPVSYINKQQVQHLKEPNKNNSKKRKQKLLVNSQNKNRFHLGVSTKTQMGVKRVNIISSKVVKTNLTDHKLMDSPLYFDKQQHEIKAKHLEFTPNSGLCFPTTIHESVSLKYGPESGDFYDYGNIGEMENCVDLCCRDSDCDVAFMIGRTCYTTSCYTMEKCQMIPASKMATLRSQLAYVVKKTDLNRSLKLSESKWNNFRLRKKARKINHHEIKTEEISNQHPFAKNFITSRTSNDNVPRALVNSCHHGKILRDHILVGGHRAGVYKLRGKTPRFAACFALCCADMFCNAAFLLDRKCYSVQCYRNTTCDGRQIKARSLHSMLSFVTRDGDDDKDPDKSTSMFPSYLLSTL